MKKYTVYIEYQYGKVTRYETDKRPKMLNDVVMKINEMFFSLVNVENIYTVENI